MVVVLKRLIYQRGNLHKRLNDVINDHEIDVVVELIGGVTVAKTIILEAIRNGKHVVTANKALLAMMVKKSLWQQKKKCPYFLRS